MGYLDGLAHLDAKVDKQVDLKKCLVPSDTLFEAIQAGLQSKLSYIMFAVKNRDFTLARQGLIKMYDLVGELMKQDSEECKHLAKVKQFKMDEYLQTNGTRIQFVNTFGRKVDVTSTVRIMAKNMEKMLDLMSQGNLTTEHALMFKMGKQLGLTQKLVEKTGARPFNGMFCKSVGVFGFSCFSVADSLQMPSNTVWPYVIVLLLGSIGATVLWLVKSKRAKKQQAINDEAPEVMSIN